MKLKLNGIKFKYNPTYYKREDDLNVKLPSYSIYRYGKIFYNNEWKECRFYVIDRLGKSRLEVSSVGIIKEGISDIGKVDSQGNVKTIELSKYKRFIIKIYDFIFLCKVNFISYFDKIKLIKKNLHYILIALLGSVVYFLINHFCDNILQELINKSNLIQSIIVFLSLSSIINIIHPFTLRKEWTIKEIDDLIIKRIEKHKEDIEHENYIKKQSEF